MKILLTFFAFLLATSSATECKDKMPSCAKYKFNVCTWNVVKAKENCAKTCNMCDDEGTCVDEAGKENCKLFARNPEKCKKMEFFAKRCRRTCGTCGNAEALLPVVKPSTSLPLVKEECKDKWTVCEKYKKECARNVAIAKQYCPKTCNMCGDETIQPEQPGLQPERPVLSCGNPKFQIDESAIVGKKEARQHSFPWQVEICSTADSVDGTCSHFCGGSIIDKEWVLTARHCVDFDWKYSSIKLKFGVHDTKDNNGPNVLTRGIDKVLKDIGVKDIALIKISAPIKYTDNIQPICIPKNYVSAEVTAPGKLGFVSGWGATSEGGAFSDVLRQVQVPFRKVEDCRRVYKRRMSHHALCAGGNGSDTCQGDSGSPLVVKSKNGHWFQVGVVAFGDGCGNNMQPGVYEKPLCRWITSKIGKNVCVNF